MTTRNGTITRVSTFRDYVELTKPRIVVMIVLTAMAGFYVGAGASLDLALLFHAMIGTALVVGSANTLNQVLEREADAKMRRTENRPLPAGRLEPQEALYYGVGMAVVGLLYLAVGVNPLTATIGLISWVNYVFVYTPLKKKTSVSTLVGAISGAAPPVMGWTAIRGTLSPEAAALFLILFFWQIPHFLAIAWIYRDEYEQAGFPMLPVVDREGRRTGRQIVLYCVALIPVSVMPSMLGMAGGVYFFGALALTLIFLGFGIRTVVHKSILNARHLFFYSLLYLPALLGLMIFNKTGL